MTKVVQNIVQELRCAMTGFWEEQLQVEAKSEGFAVAMPLMDSSGWQVVVHLAPLMPGQWRISDNGATLGMLDDSGMRLDGKKLRDVIDTHCRFYGFQREGLVLQRPVQFPFDPVEIQIFAEGLVALSHLCPKGKVIPPSRSGQRMEERLSRYFHDRHWAPKRHHKLAGAVEPEIEVDFYWDGIRPLALQPVGRSRKLRGYMEQWGWRWTDLSRAQPDLLRAMVYDPDLQEWDSASKRIGEEVCDIFVPVFEVEEALDAFLAA